GQRALDRGSLRAAVPAASAAGEDGIRPRLRQVLAIQDPDLFRPARRDRSGAGGSRFPRRQRTLEIGMDQDHETARLGIHLLRHETCPPPPLREISASARDQAVSRGSAWPIVTGMYAAAYPGLAPRHLVRRGGPRDSGFPFDAPRRWCFYRARNAIYY